MSELPDSTVDRVNIESDSSLGKQNEKVWIGQRGLDRTKFCAVSRVLVNIVWGQILTRPKFIPAL